MDGLQEFKTAATTALLTVLRNKDTSREKYVDCCDRLCNLLAEETLAYFAEEATVETPCGKAQGTKYPNFKDYVIVSIMRSGCILTKAFKKLQREVVCAKILIQRDENTVDKRPTLYYSKLPKIHNTTKIVLCDPMLATGGSALCAIQVLLNAGANESNILFVNIVACPEGIAALNATYPEVKVITISVDSHLNEHKYIVPGLGDFGDRYFGTD